MAPGVGYYMGLALDSLVCARGAAKKDLETLKRIARVKDLALLTIYQAEPDWLTEVDREYCRRLLAETLAETDGWMTRQHLAKEDTNVICVWQFAEGRDKEIMVPVHAVVLRRCV